MSDPATPAQRAIVEKPTRQSNEQRYFDALKLIAKGYSSAESLLSRGNRDGLNPIERLEYAYDNVQGEAKAAIRGKRRPTT